MNTNVLLLLQSGAAAVQVFNAGLALALPPSQYKALIVLTVAAVAAGFTVLLQNIGNKTQPK